MTAITFNQPHYLYGLIILLPLLALYIYTLRKRPAALQFSSLFFMTGIPRGHRVYLRHLPFVLRLLSCTLLIIILAQPVKSGGLHDLEKTGINIILALDISTSMKEPDLIPNRLAVAKAKAEQFIAKRTSDRMGLVIFGSEALLQCPLTLDHQVLTAFVKDIGFLKEISSQTAIGNAIAMAVIALKRGERKPHKASQAEHTALLNDRNEPLSSVQPLPQSSVNPPRGSQVIVLITDGRNTSTELDPLTAAQIAQTFGIKIYTIGIGRPDKSYLNRSLHAAPNPPPLQESFHAQSLIDEETLSQVAELTSGKYFNVQNSRALELTFKEIDALEKTTFNEKKYLIQHTQYLSFAYILFIAFSLELVLTNFYLRKKPA